MEIYRDENSSRSFEREVVKASQSRQTNWQLLNLRDMFRLFRLQILEYLKVHGLVDVLA